MPIHPAVAAKFDLLAGIPSFEALLTDPGLQERFEQFAGAGLGQEPPVVATRMDAAPGPHGPVPVRVYLPDVVGDRPCLVWMHGGAFRAGDLDMPEADWVARELCTRVGALVVSVDYRLAVGGITYPVPHDDVVAAVRWVRDSADGLGVDAGRISVGGASAGANLAAGATLRLRDDDAWQPANLILGYPVVHAVLPPPPPSLTALMTDVPRILHFPPDTRHELTTNYLGGPESRADGYAMPALAVLGGLCPTLILNAEYDDLRVSGQAFAAALAEAGVDERQVQVKTMLHGFLNLPSAIEPVGQALDLIADVVVARALVGTETA
ncbi:MAG TPA: alpha/beta hydrolase [Pseudonocardiaceae bacterium]